VRTGRNGGDESTGLPLAHEVRGNRPSRLFTDLANFQRPIPGRTFFIILYRRRERRMARLSDDSNDDTH
jgi:hypothetical protein